MLQLTTIIFLVASSTLALIHTLAVHLFLYWRFPWLDIPMHAFGGMVVALGFFTLRDLRFFPNKMLHLVSVLALVLFVALCWEAFELIIGVPIIGNYYLDTAADVSLGLLGGLVGYIAGNSVRKLR